MYSAVLKKLDIIELLGSISRGRKSNVDEVLHFCVRFLSFVLLFHFFECFLSPLIITMFSWGQEEWDNVVVGV